MEADPIDDVSPGVMVGRSKGAEPPRLLAPELDRPVGNWLDCDLNGWVVYGRSGPFWLDDRRLVAVISDRGRSHPPGLRPGRRSEPDTPHRRRHHDPHDRRQPDRRRRDAPDRGHAGHGAHHGRGRHGTATGTDPVAPRLALAGRLRAARDALHRGARTRRPDRRVDRVPGRLQPEEGAAPFDRQHPRRAARRVGTEPAYRGVPAHRGGLSRDPAEHPRLGDVRRRLDPAPARRYGRCRCRRRPRRRRPRRRRSGWRTRTDSG